MPVTTLQTGTTTRYRTRVNGQMCFIKQPSRLLRARAITELAGLTRAEVRFYLELAGEVPICVPKLVRAHHRRWAFELVLEDLVAVDCQMFAPSDQLEAEQVRRVLLALAALHSAFWEDPRFKGELRWLNELRQREQVLGKRMARPLTELGLARAGTLVPPMLRRPARRCASERARVKALLARGPRTLTHHDCHPGNLFFTTAGEAGLLDWQMVRTGNWAADVAYLLATSLSVADRRKFSEKLVNDYLDALPRQLRPTRDNALLAVRAHTASAFEAMLLTLAIGGLMARKEIEQLVHRTAVAVVDTHSFTLLGLR